MGETGLELVRADLLIAGMAFGAMAAARNERHRDAIADLEANDAPAGRHHLAGEFMAGHVRQLDVRVMAHPAMPIATAKPRRADGDHDAVLAWRGVGRVRISGVASKAS